MTKQPNSTIRGDERDEDELPAGVRAGLRDATIPIATTDPGSDGDDLAAVGERLADAAVVGLGEATHGTREFFQLKHRLLQELVMEHGVRAFAMEANLPEAMALYDYVVHGEGDPREALSSVYFWTWQAESVLAMVEWLRAFNEGRPLADRVAVYGFDAQYTQGAVARLREHFDRVDPAFLEAIAADLDAVDDDGEHPQRADPETLRERAQAAERLVERVREQLVANRDAHVAATSTAAFERVQRYAAVVEQVIDVTAPLVGPDGELLDDDETMERMTERRDRAMADNVAWLREHADGTPLVLWAHDSHLNRVEQGSSDGDAGPPSLGRHLADRLGEDYYALGFSFGTGAFQAISEVEAAEDGDGGPEDAEHDDAESGDDEHDDAEPADGESEDGESGEDEPADGGHELGAHRIEEPVPGTVDWALQALGEPLAFVDVRAASEDDRCGGWLEDPHGQFRTGAVYECDDPSDQLVESVIADAFDGLCFVAETTRARPLDVVDGPTDYDERT